jgi:putative tryptophan/tyrosine transport system substrate-binding protein
MPFDRLKRRDFITLVGGAAAWPLAARGQQSVVPVVGFIYGGSIEGSARFATAFRKGLGEAGLIEGHNVAVEYHWLNGQYDRLPALLADLVRRRVALIATPGSHPATLAAKAATATIPIVFGVADDPVRLGLVASLARPGGNAAGINFFSREVTGKRLRLLHDFVPKAVRVALLLNPANAGSAEAALHEVREAAPSLGLQVQPVYAKTIGEIDAAFAKLATDRPDALFLAGDGFFLDRRVQFAILAARDRLPASYAQSDFVEVGGLMSYGTNNVEMFRLVGVYCSRILKGEKPAEVPVLQMSKFEFVINLQTARALSIEVPPDVLSIADEAIE